MSPIELEDHLIDGHHYAVEYIISLDAEELRTLHHDEHAGINQVGHEHE